MSSPRLHVPSRTAVVVAALVAAGRADAGTTIHVPTDHPTIQAAIDAAVDGDTVEVSDGTYKEHIAFEGKAITVRSVHGAASTIIDGTHSGTVVSFVTGATGAITGFTIRNGLGGILVAAGAAVTISHNVITNNAGCEGIGITVARASPIIRDNVITENHGDRCSGGSGGAIEVSGTSSAQILNNTISRNAMVLSGDGGAISLFNSGTVTIRGNLIADNTAEGDGGAIMIVNESTPIIVDNTIIHNSALRRRGGGIAALVPFGSPGPRIINNTIAGNAALEGGSEMCLDGFVGDTQIWNNIFLGTTAQAAVVCDATFSTTPPALRFNDAFNIGGGASYAGSCAAAAGSDGNLSVDPLLVDVTSDFHPRAASPVIDAGSNAAPSLPTDDLASFARILDGNGDGVATVDLGAYELGGSVSLALDPIGLTFPGQLVGSSASPAQSITLTSTGDGPIAISQVAITGDFAQTSTCSTTLDRGRSCTFSVTFLPTEPGSRTGSLTITDDAPGSPHEVALRGAGTDFALEPAPGGAGAATIAAGAAARYDLEVAPIGGFTGSVALACAGAPSGATCTVSPATVMPGGSAAPFTVSVTTEAGDAVAAVPARPWPPRPIAVVAALAAMAAALARRIAPPCRRRRRVVRAAFGIAIGAGLVISGCSRRAEVPAGTGTGTGTETPAGHYELTVTGSASGLSHAISLPLIVE